ncbi:hypothetical protein Heshes_23530 [Alicyclobacillus hesperidum]|uniref:PAS fold-containing protein n=1 Tax=Alicyclobacillus hesperidum TaxID=89784 RepID=A0A1H2VBA3_9BACL|nr:hypothetical protein [Alicyclobacillus hesperidum]GLV14669.1 hypothetical protein Heshes_23530 [Alicyclobacillus hesperidum]SDW65573.1 hypothetical protein SAMN04489725_11076 [Alicyclobacillus hesperidum]
MHALEHLPVPGFLVFENYDVIQMSDTAKATFGKKVANILDVIDHGSRTKLSRFLCPSMAGIKVELNFCMPQGIGLFDVYHRWRTTEVGDTIGFLACVPRQSDLEEVLHSVARLEQHLISRESVQRPRELQDGIWNHIDQSIHTIEELLGIFHGDLIEVGKGIYAELILKELDSLRTLIQEHAEVPL